MGRLRPTEVFPYSKGKKRFLFQDIIVNHSKYFYCLLDGRQKTKLYNSGVLDGSKKPIPLTSFKEENLVKGKWLLAVPKKAIRSRYVDEKEFFTGRIGVVNTFILKVDSIGSFVEYTCVLPECPFQGMENCFKMFEKDCSSPNRERHAVGRFTYA